jgi:hypothetical protein
MTYRFGFSSYSQEMVDGNLMSCDRPAVAYAASNGESVVLGTASATFFVVKHCNAFAAA